MRVRKLMIQRMINMKRGRIESKRRLKDEAIMAAQEAKALLDGPLYIEAKEVQDASKGGGKEDSREIDWEGSRKVLISGKSEVGSTSKKRSKARVETNKEGIV